MTTRRGSGVWMLAACLAACHVPTPSGEAKHPVDNYRVFGETVPTILPIEPLNRIQIRDVLGLNSPGINVRLGHEDGQRAEVFGRIESVWSREGRLYVLDSHASEVRIFDATWRFEATVGRAGHGPGEFTRAVSLVVDNRGSVYVGDLGGREHIFRVDRKGEYSYFDSFALPVAPLDACMMRDVLYVHGNSMTERNVIHAFSSDGRHLMSFGRVYTSGTPLVDAQIVRGLIDCVESQDLVVYAPSGVLGEVRAYSSTGELAWVTMLEGFRPITFTETERGGTRVVVPDGGHNFVYSLMSLGDHVLLQVGLATPQSVRDKVEFQSLETFVIDARDGTGEYVTSDLARVVAGEDLFLVGAQRDPFPQLVRYDLSPEFVGLE